MAEFRVGVLQDFVARHYLVGGDFGPEGSPHSHHYRVELTVAGERLDGHGFLVDIVRLRAELDGLVDRYRDRMLNDLPELRTVNPGVESVARAMAEALSHAFRDDGLSWLEVKLWENESAWASHRIEARGPGGPPS
jgi:6-pyruvoyltetrahydropterin/6-carboxytetrahydropterin synthase